MAVWHRLDLAARLSRPLLPGISRDRGLAEGEPPLRAELFGPAQLESHVRARAAAHDVGATHGPERLLRRLRENREIIRHSYATAAQAARQNRRVSPAEEWLLDNYPLIDEQIDLARRHLPPGYSLELPYLRAGPLEGFPRVYDLALVLVSHTDGRVDAQNLTPFVTAYESVKPLTMGELWAIPIMLRLTLIENLRRVAQRMTWRRNQGDLAQQWAQRFLGTVQANPRALIIELADFVRAGPPRSPPFIAEIAAALEGVHPTLGMVINWIEQELAERGQNIAAIRQAESQDHAADQASVANSITSLRGLAGIDWRAFVEALSSTEAILKRDPADVYSKMDFRSRDAYRHAVEDLARACRGQEAHVAETAVRLAAARQSDPSRDPREAHVGYFLVGDGREVLEGALACRVSASGRIGRLAARRPVATYLTIAALFTVAAAAPLFREASRLWPEHLAIWGLLAMALILAASRTGVSVANWLATLVVKPRRLPRLDFSKGIPSEHRTVVAVPAMLSSPEAVDRMIERLEVRYLMNRLPNLLFALLTDFPDATGECDAADQALLDMAARGIRRLDARYAEHGPGVFFLLHRPRLWNPHEGVWMGYERKRGKLSDFNRLVKEGVSKPFSFVEGNVQELRTVRHVITLDEDTQLPPETAWKMVGTIAHLLNSPRVDPVTGLVTRGYGVLQPRLATSLTSAQQSRFARMFAGEVGIDPYTREVSNLYHDCFGAAQFVGKGIYSVEAFASAVGCRFPPNRILSHDLIEGCHARCGFINDVELIEDHPAHFLADVQRRHRWARGDWQIARWLSSRVPGPDGAAVNNPLGGLAQWMIADNLRRSLGPGAWLLAFLLGWVALPGMPFAWLLLAVLFAPDVLRGLGSLAIKATDSTWAEHVLRVWTRERRLWTLGLLDVAFLPYQAFVFADAQVRVGWRLLIRRRRLLEWVTAADAERGVRAGLGPVLREMWVLPLFAAASAVAAAAAGSPPGGLSVPLCALWFASPFLAWFISRPSLVRRVELTKEQTRFLRTLAWRTWLYFEEFAGPEHHWLPPDNFQETPQPTVAGRTSPTNIGLSLLSNLAAHDLGYISSGRLVERTDRAFATMDRLPRYRGHFYNWYDTRTLEPLHPIYVSSVDSGNLVGLIASLKGGLHELGQQPVLPSRWREGVQDAADALLEDIDAQMGEAVGEDAAVLRTVGETVRAQARAMSQASQALPEIHRALAGCVAALHALPAPGEALGGTAGHLAALCRQCEDLSAETLHFAPWLAEEGEDWASLSAEAPGDSPLIVIRSELDAMPSLDGLASLRSRLAPALDRLAGEPGSAARPGERLCALIATASEHATQRIEAIEDLAVRCDAFSDIELEFLYDPLRKLLAIGFNLDLHRRDPSCYDLLGSEARLCSFCGIARGHLPLEHWFRLGRQVAPGHGPPVLVSWSGSLFEYLMPLLVMPAHPGTLLGASCQGAVARQIRYGRARGVPWGISESCFNKVDAQKTYQYRAFGVPELGLKRGLADDLVVAPYASVLALMVAPEDACRNLQAMAGEGFAGRFGMYEAVDYTRSRLRRDERFAIVRTYMAHHSGMSLVSLDRALLGPNMQRRFLADPQLRACELLLQERIPPRAFAGPRTMIEASPERETSPGAAEPAPRSFGLADTPVPEVHLLSNGHLHTGVSNSGAGWIRWEAMAITRWREDPTRDNWGTFFYVRDVDSGRSWSTTHQPVCGALDRYAVVFSPGMAEFRSACDRIGMYTRIAVSPEDDVELRRITLTNESGRRRTIELTSYAEVVLMDGRAEAAHPAFYGLFVETQALPSEAAILCARRPKSSDESRPYLFHTLVVHGTAAGEDVSFETDRARFIGRGRTAQNPAALHRPGPLSNTDGAVLDPVVAIRRRIVLRPGESATLDSIIGVGRTRDDAVRLVEKYHDHRLAERVFDLAWTDHQVVLHQFRISEADTQLFEQIAGSVVYANPRYRAHAGLIARNRKGQSGLWGFGISGDLPIVLLRIGDLAGLDMVRQMIQAHAFWRHKGLRVDLVVWAEAYSGYRQPMLDAIVGAVHSSSEAKLLDQPGGIFVQSIDKVPDDDQVLFQAVARVILSDRSGTLAEQVERRRQPPLGMPRIASLRPTGRPVGEKEQEITRDLMFFNGYGGFTPDGREYVIILRPDVLTPLPWVNVLANPEFGSVVSESGGGYTWYSNAHEFRLTPWSNDAVCDTPGEAYYVRDEDTGVFWSPAPGPARGPTPYVCRHGTGYTVFEHTQDGVASEMTVYVAPDAPAKFVLITLHNRTERPRRLSVTGFCEWVLGEDRERHAMHVATRQDPQSRALFAWNAFSVDAQARVAFFHCSAPSHTATADRTEFVGRNGSLRNPAAMGRVRLSNRVGAGWDPCGALQAYVDLPPGRTEEIVFVLGAAENEEAARSVLRRFNGVAGGRQALEAVWRFWKEQLGGVYIETPDASVNFLVNHWLLYQVLASRFWGRSGFYQSGGAFGFRDQLQDSLAFLHECPWLTRQHLLTCASRQFREGDVQHWWHPPVGRGVRTRIADDLLWLPYVACRYVEATADTGVLDEPVPFLEGRALATGEESYYDRAAATEQRATLYEHCLRAIRRALQFGPHGLPLIQSGDWNDGMNRVGHNGQGESVWLAFFLYSVLRGFGRLAAERNDADVARECETAADGLRQRIEAGGWDGQWYLRAFFDDGTPLGSAQNPECQIDLLPQSWAALSGAADEERVRSALQSVMDRLVDPAHGLIRLFDPPFDAAPWDPGYIKGYVPGVRENGGQYTHAAVWAAMAFAGTRQAERAWQLFGLINPIRHGDTAERVATYKAEPYVVAADVYTARHLMGRGGWTWYTGAAGWMYQLLVDKVLGLTRRGDTLLLTPLFPPDWSEYTVHYRYQSTFYHIRVVKAGVETWNIRRLTIDGVEQTPPRIPLVDDRREHAVQVEAG